MLVDPDVGVREATAGSPAGDDLRLHQVAVGEHEATQPRIELRPRVVGEYEQMVAWDPAAA